MNVFANNHFIRGPIGIMFVRFDVGEVFTLFLTFVVLLYILVS